MKSAYALARRAGLLERHWFRRVYWHAYAAYKRTLEDPFAALLRQQPSIARGGSIADVGAHIGYTAMVFARALDPGFRVFAFEPDPANATLLRENLALEIAGGRVVPVEAAVGSASGKAELMRSAAHPGDHRIGRAGRPLLEDRTPVTVSMLSLDEYFEARAPESLVLVKVDVQGFEIEVCLGMARTLDRGPVPWVAIEHSPAEAGSLGFDARAVPAFLREHGYTPRLLHRDGGTAPWPSPAAEALLARRGYVDLLCERNR